MKKIAIIGAGLTGMTIAHQLHKKFHVTVFEKSRGLGGRMATRYANDFEFDRGAQYFTATSEIFQEFILTMIDKGIVARWDARFVELNGSEIVSQRVWDANYPHYIGTPRMNAVCRYLSSTVDLRLNKNVKTITSDKNWRLFDDNNHDLGSYDWVIVTAPAEQTAQLMPQSFKFMENILSIKMQGCYSLMLGLESEPDVHFDAAQVNNADISWISVNSTKPGRNPQPTMIVHSSNQWADINRNQDLKTVADHLSHELKRVIGFDIGRQIKVMIPYRWRFANIGKQPYSEGLIDEERQLAACGDWCIQGRVESAFLVGHRVANNLIKIIDERK